jgi:sigma-B regulation protein RsbU (phosphoserine phosphatase)
MGEPITLNPGDSVILLTDGVLEASSPEGELFGMDRVLQILRQNSNKAASDVIERLHHEVQEFTCQDHLLDDFTVVVIKASTSTAT